MVAPLTEIQSSIACASVLPRVLGLYNTLRILLFRKTSEVAKPDLYLLCCLV